MEPLTTLRIDKLEKSVKTWRAVSIASLACIIATASLGFKNPNSIIRTQGLIIVDTDGKERILLGGPVPETTSRKNPDQETGIVILDQMGQERLAIGQSKPDYREESYGLLMYEKTGQERGGMGVSDSGKAVIALDRAYPDRDAIGFLVDPERDFVGFMLLHKLLENQGTVAALLGVENGVVSFDLNDSKGTPRSRMTVELDKPPSFKAYDQSGKLLKELISSPK